MVSIPDSHAYIFLFWTERLVSASDGLVADRAVERSFQCFTFSLPSDLFFCCIAKERIPFGISFQGSALEAGQFANCLSSSLDLQLFGYFYLLYLGVSPNETLDRSLQSTSPASYHLVTNWGVLSNSSSASCLIVTFISVHCWSNQFTSAFALAALITRAMMARDGVFCFHGCNGRCESSSLSR